MLPRNILSLPQTYLYGYNYLLNPCRMRGIQQLLSPAGLGGRSDPVEIRHREQILDRSIAFSGFPISTAVQSHHLWHIGWAYKSLLGGIQSNKSPSPPSALTGAEGTASCERVLQVNARWGAYSAHYTSLYLTITRWCVTCHFRSRVCGLILQILILE